MPILIATVYLIGALIAGRVVYGFGRNRETHRRDC